MPRCSPNWNGCARRKSFSPPKRFRCAICCAARFQILNGYDDWTFAPETAVFTVREHFKVASLDGFGLKDKTAAIGAAGGALHYLTQHLRRDVKHLTRISFYQRSDFLTLDYTTLRHLEILEPLHHDAPRNASLYGALNRTVTPMGARLLRQLAFAAARRGRADSPAAGRGANFHRKSLRPGRVSASNSRRCAIWNARIGRLSSGSGNARDLVALRLALEQIPALKQILDNAGARVRRAPESLINDDSDGCEDAPAPPT